MMVYNDMKTLINNAIKALERKGGIKFYEYFIKELEEEWEK